MPDSGLTEKVAGARVLPVTAGNAIVVDARGMATLTVVTGAGATATISRVDSATAGAHTTGPNAEADLAESSKLVLTVDWPWYRVSVAGGSCRVSLV